MLFSVILSLLCGFVILMYIRFKKIYRYWTDKGVEILNPVFPFGNMLDLLKEKTGITPCIMEWYKKSDGKVLGLYAIDEPILLIRDPDITKNILVRDFNSFTDRGVYIDEREPTAGHLWKLPGTKWRPLRSKMSTCFSMAKLKMMFSNLLKVGEEMEKHLQEESSTKENFNIGDLCSRFTADVVASSIFGIENNSFVEKDNQYFLMEENLVKSDSRIRMIKASLQIICPNFFELFSFIKFETVKQNVLGFVYELVRTVVEFRERTGTVRNDMMQLLIQLKNYGKVNADDGEKAIMDGNEVCLTMNEVVAQAYTYFLVGSETGSTVLTMLLYESALNETIQERLHQDIDEALQTSGGKITYEAILDMKYLDMVIKETLRKYPALGFLQRKAVKDYTIPDLDLKIEKGTRLYFSIQGMHMDPKNYPMPEIFDPERFSRQNESKIASCAYLPFGEGPRNCIGKRLGFLMVAVGAVSIFRKFRLEVCEDTEIPVKMNPLAYTFQTTNPIYLKISNR